MDFRQAAEAQEAMTGEAGKAQVRVGQALYC
jgi:hypothetical protein